MDSHVDDDVYQKCHVINSVVNALPGLEFLRAGSLLKSPSGIHWHTIDGLKIDTGSRFVSKQSLGIISGRWRHKNRSQ